MYRLLGGVHQVRFNYTIAQREIDHGRKRLMCSPTGMFALPNPMSHVSSAAFAQARLRPAHLRLRSA